MIELEFDRLRPIGLTQAAAQSLLTVLATTAARCASPRCSARPCCFTTASRRRQRASCRGWLVACSTGTTQSRSAIGRSGRTTCTATCGVHARCAVAQPHRASLARRNAPRRGEQGHRAARHGPRQRLQSAAPQRHSLHQTGTGVAGRRTDQGRRLCGCRGRAGDGARAPARPGGGLCAGRTRCTGRQGPQPYLGEGQTVVLLGSSGAGKST